MPEQRATSTPPAGRAGHLLPAAAGVSVALALLLYLPTMPPTITWWFGGSDSGDLISAADVLGVPHPTGYPLFVVLGFVATRVPLGEVAGRVNAMNALLGALGAGGTALAVGALAVAGQPDDGRDGRDAGGVLVPLAALGGALAVATSALYWSQAIIGEVYALHAALAALVLWLWARTGTHPALRGAAHGLALTNHLTSIILLAAALTAFVRPHRPRPIRAAAWFLAGVALPLSLYLLLPLRAAQHPSANWGDPQTLGRFLTHVTGRQYHAYVNWHDVGGVLRDLPALLRLVIGDLPPFALPLAAVGFVRLWDARREYALFSGLVAAGVLLFTAVYRIPDRAPYLLPGYLVLGIWCGVGLATAAGAARRWIRQEAGRGRWAAAAAAGLLILLAVWTVRTERRVSLHGDDSALVFAQATLRSLPAGASYYTARDDVTFALWYAQRALGVRPDVRVVDVRNPQLSGVR